MQLSVVWDATPCCQKDTNILKSRGNIFLGKICRLRLKCDGTRAETRLRLSTKRTSPFKWAGGSVQSTTGRQAVHIILQGLYCSCKPVFCSHATLTGYPLHSLVSLSLLLPCVTVCQHISNAVYLHASLQEVTPHTTVILISNSVKILYLL